MEAFRNAAFSVAAGIYDIVLALGVEKLKDRQSRGLPRVDWHPLLIKGNRFRKNLQNRNSIIQKTME
jgi:acetyl-CoA C-acetyltransferase